MIDATQAQELVNSTAIDRYPPYLWEDRVRIENATPEELQAILDEYAPKVAEKVVDLHKSLSTEQKSKMGKIIDKRLGQRRKSAFGRRVRRQVNTLP